MPRVINIEIMRLKPTKKTAIVMAFFALIIGCMITALPGTEAKYASAEQDRHVFTFRQDLEVGVEVTEEQWAIKFGDEGFNVSSGKTIVKDPVITNTKNDCYMRACIRITDEDGNPISVEQSASLVNGILGTIWYDPAGDAAGDAEGTSSASALNVNKSYSSSNLREMSEAGTAMAVCNKNKFEDPVYNEEMQAFTMNYKGVFKAEDKVTLFNRIVISSDSETAKLQARGTYYIVVWPQAIQTAGFTDSDAALKKLSNNYVPTQIPELTSQS